MYLGEHQPRRPCDHGSSAVGWPLESDYEDSFKPRSSSRSTESKDCDSPQIPLTAIRHG
jgi:hypothetical protein